MTTLGVIGLGRIGAFHTDTLSGLDGIDNLVITDERPEVVAAVAAKHNATAVGFGRGTALLGHRRCGRRGGDPRACRTDAGRRRARYPDVLREADRVHGGGNPQGLPASSPVRACRYRSAISAASTSRSPRPSVPSTTDRSACSTPSAARRWIPPRRRWNTSRAPAASSATARCTTSTSCGGSPVRTPSTCTPPAACRVIRSSRSSVTSTPPPWWCGSNRARSA